MIFCYGKVHGDQEGKPWESPESDITFCPNSVLCRWCPTNLPASSEVVIRTVDLRQKRKRNISSQVLHSFSPPPPFMFLKVDHSDIFLVSLLFFFTPWVCRLLLHWLYFSAVLFCFFLSLFCVSLSLSIYPGAKCAIITMPSLEELHFLNPLAFEG